MSFYLNLSSKFLLELFLVKLHIRYHRLRKTGDKLRPARNISPITAIGSDNANARLHLNWFRDREEWFPGRQETASRLKERGKNLVVELQEIVTWPSGQLSLQHLQSISWQVCCWKLNAGDFRFLSSAVTWQKSTDNQTSFYCCSHHSSDLINIQQPHDICWLLIFHFNKTNLMTDCQIYFLIYIY